MHRGEGDEKQEFGFHGFGHIKCEMSPLLTCVGGQEKCWMCKSGVQRRSLNWKRAFRSQQPRDGR